MNMLFFSLSTLLCVAYIRSVKKVLTFSVTANKRKGQVASGLRVSCPYPSFHLPIHRSLLSFHSDLLFPIAVREKEWAHEQQEEGEI